MAAKKATKKAATPRRSRARTIAITPPPAPLTCEDCGRALQLGEDPAIAEIGGCIRCEHEKAFPGRDYDTDAKAAEQRGIRLASYVREQLDGTMPPEEGRPERVRGR